jgi:Leucine-rich repeat (LRR) protein
MASSISNKKTWSVPDYRIWLRDFSNTNTTFPNLERLMLGYSNINSLPESIGNLTGLNILNLSDTQVTSLPESIGNLTNLQKFTKIRCV